MEMKMKRVHLYLPAFVQGNRHASFLVLITKVQNLILLSALECLNFHVHYATKHYLAKAILGNVLAPTMIEKVPDARPMRVEYALCYSHVDADADVDVDVDVANVVTYASKANVADVDFEAEAEPFVDDLFDGYDCDVDSDNDNKMLAMMMYLENGYGISVYHKVPL